ncbi:MAG: acetyltransferase [Acidobacteria bacterium]|nr:acetyltransferase [Acidobacteriota bacterium]
MEPTLRSLRRDDLPLLGSWLREPLVHEWWYDDPAPAALERQYGPAIDGLEPTVVRIGELTPPGSDVGEPVGFVQWYPLDSEPGYAGELARFLPIPDGAWSLDYLVGSPAYRGRGVGSALVRRAVRIVGVAPIVVAVHARNLASQHVLRHAGFVVAAQADLEPDNPGHSRDHLVLVRPPVRDGAAAP